jgi:hypothetical protein
MIKDAADIDDLKRRVTPLTPDQVQKRMNKILGLADDAPVATGAAVKKAAPKAAVKTPAVSMTDDEELGNSFPDYDQNA